MKTYIIHFYDLSFICVNSHQKQKFKSEKQRFEDLKLNLETLKEQWRADKERRFTKYELEIAEVINSFECKINGEKGKISAISTDIQSMRCDFDLTKILLEEDADQEIADLKKHFEKILKSERAQTLELRGNNGMLKREFAGLQQRIKKGNDRMHNSLEEQNKLIEEIRRLEKDINGYEREIAERDSTIKEKNKMISEVQKKNQELEKFKFVLDYKIHELDRQIKPRERTIINIDKQLTEMNDEIGKYKNDNRFLSLKIKDLKLKSKGLKSEDCAQNQRNIGLQNVIKIIGHELQKLHKNASDSQLLKNGIIQLHKQFAEFHLEHMPSTMSNRNTELLKRDANMGMHEEFQRQRNYLERRLQGLQKKQVKNSLDFKKDSARIMQENVALIKEINELRREIASAQEIRNQSLSLVDIRNENKNKSANREELEKEIRVSSISELENNIFANDIRLSELLQLKDSLILNH